MSNAVDTESTPLLPEDVTKKAITPLPKVQLSLICLIRLTEPICFNAVLPFINQMLLDVGAASSPDSVGYAAGIVEGVFSVTQLLTVFHWGTLSDRIGRKPVLIIGAVGSAVAGILFGFSRSFVALVITRSLIGMMNGNVAVLKSIMGEISDETNQSKAFSFFPLCLNVGNLIAAFIGGTFARPAIRFPRFAKAFPIFQTFPYLLPNLLAALFPIAAALTAFIWLKETLPPPKEKRIDRDGDTTETGSNAVGDGDEVDTFKMSDLFTRKINSIMFSFGVLSLMGSAMGGLLPLYCFTPVLDGGLGFKENQIGYALSARAISIIIVQLGAFPYLQRRVGTLRLYRVLLNLWIPAFLGLPLLNLLARQSQTTAVWIGLVITFAFGSVANMAFVCNLLLVNDAAPSRRSLGAINGLSQAVSSGVRIFGPGGASVLFAVSIGHHVLGGNLIWLVCGIIAVIGVISGAIIPTH